jgi:hypothetical protein
MWKRHAIGIAACLGLLAQSGITSAQSEKDVFSANSIMPGCRNAMSNNGREPIKQGICLGVVQTMLYLSGPVFGLCTPEGANLEQVLRVVVRYIDRRPDRTHERFENLALEAVLEAWPCPK